MGSVLARKAAQPLILARVYDLHRCADEAVRRNPNALPRYKKLAIRFVIESSGTVSTKKTTGVPPELDACLRAQFNSMTVKLPSFRRDQTLLQVISYWNKLAQKVPTVARNAPVRKKPKPSITSRFGSFVMSGVRAYVRHQKSDQRKKQSAAARRRAELYPSRCFRAAIAMDVTVSRIGRPLDANFDFLRGKSGRSLIISAEISQEKLNYFEAYQGTVDSVDERRANAKAWGFSISGSSAKRTNEAFNRAVFVTGMIGVNDTAVISHANTPARARYFLAKVWVGHMYEAALWGSSSVLTVGVSGKFFIFSGNAKAFAGRRDLRSKVTALGLKASLSTLLAESVGGIAAAFRNSGGFGVPQPVLATYCTIEGRK